FQYNKVYKSLKELAQNGENFCKQITSVLQQSCLSTAWAWASESMKSAADLHQKLGKAIESEAIKPTHQVLSMQEKKRKSLDNEVEKTANLVVNNWNQQIKATSSQVSKKAAKKKLMVSTKKHEALFHLVESSKHSVTQKEKQKLLNKLKKSTEKLEKEDENYYQKNLAGYSTRLKWESTLESCYKSMLELEKERIQLLCNNLNQYSQHISLFGQTLTTVSSRDGSIPGVYDGAGKGGGKRFLSLPTPLCLVLQCHTQIHCAISKVDVEKDIQALMEETAILSTENKSEFLLTDYFNALASPFTLPSTALVPAHVWPTLCLENQPDLEQKLKTLSGNSSFADAKSQKDAEALMDENSLKLDLLQANSYKLSSVLADLEQRPKPSHPCSACIFKWKEKEHSHTYVRISRPLLTARLEKTVSQAPSGGQSSRSSSPSASVSRVGNSLCKALYTFQARQDDELNLEKGDIVTLHEKKEEGWWFGSLNGKKGHFPAAYVEELPSKAGNAATQS
ncbi:hypothetical protein U0070_001485, partial [Myodes glareolus]